MTNQRKTICVFCASSTEIEEHYFVMASELGTLIGQRGYDLVYGGTNIGLMGLIATKAQQNGSRITGVIPKKFAEKGIAKEDIHELILTDNLRDRKAKMIELADIFIILPGGFGTLEELMEVISAKQIQEHNHPIVILNYRDFFSPLLAQFETIFRKKFAKSQYRQSYHVATSPIEVIEYIESNYSAAETQRPQRWNIRGGIK